MINLLNVFVLSSAVFFSLTAWTQVIEDPIAKVQYGEGAKLHARGITSDMNMIYVAASNGRLYSYNTKTKQTKVSAKGNTIEFRDLAVVRKNILVMSSGDSSEMTVFDRNLNIKKATKFDGFFLDGFATLKNKVFLMGDPIHGKFSLFSSSDGGKNYREIQDAPQCDTNEAAFAASGTTVQMKSNKEWTFITGGQSSRFFLTTNAGQTWTQTSLGFESCATCGGNSMVLLPNQKIVVVGGDFNRPDERTLTCRISNDGGLSWHSPTSEPNGYRSNVIFHDNILYACGTNGIDYSIDFGDTWIPLAKGTYYTITVHETELVASTRNASLHFFQLKKKD